MPKYIPDIKPGDFSWTVKVTILSKGSPIVGRPGKSDYQRLLLSDEKGHQVQASIFGPHINHWEKSLERNRQYYVSNAHVKHLPAQFRSVPCEHQWILNNKTIIEDADVDGSGLPQHYLFTPFTKFPEHLESQFFIDVVAIVADLRPPREITLKSGLCMVQEIVLIDEELFPVMLSVWGAFVDKEVVHIADVMKTDYPVIIASKIKAVSYKGLSLSTRTESEIILDSKLARVVELKKWGSENAERIIQSISAFSNGRKQWNLPPVKAITTTSVVSLNELPHKAIAWVVASVVVINGIQKYYFVVCNKCDKSIFAECGRKFKCSFCGQQSIGIPRARFEVVVSDHSGCISAQLFGDLAERHFKLTIDTIVKEDSELGYFDYKEHPQFSDPSHFMVQIKVSDRMYNDNTYKHFIINNIQPIDKENQEIENGSNSGSFHRQEPVNHPVASASFHPPKRTAQDVVVKPKVKARKSLNVKPKDPTIVPHLNTRKRGRPKKDLLGHVNKQQLYETPNVPTIDGIVQGTPSSSGASSEDK